MGINIIKCTSTANTTPCNRTPEYIVLHYTAGTNSKPGAAMNVAKAFANPAKKASADFIVDQGTIVQYNPDPKKYYCWAVGGSKYSSMTTNEGGKFYGIAKNSNCVSIEMCSNKKSTKTLNATDTDWYLEDSVVDNALELTKYLMQLYNIPVSKIIMHHHVTGKVCANPWCVNQLALSKWYAFKSRLTSTQPIIPAPTPQPTPSSTEKKYYRVNCGSYKTKANCENMIKTVKQKGFNAIMKEVDGMYKCQVGAYSIEKNAKDMAEKVKAKGISCFVTYC